MRNIEASFPASERVGSSPRYAKKSLNLCCGTPPFVVLANKDFQVAFACSLPCRLSASLASRTPSNATRNDMVDPHIRGTSHSALGEAWYGEGRARRPLCKAEVWGIKSLFDSHERHT